MAGEILVVGAVALLVGGTVAYFIVKKTKVTENFLKEDKIKNEVLNNPELLLEKLTANGEIIDDGQVIEPIIVEKNGKKTVDFKRTDKLTDKEKAAIEEKINPKPKPAEGQKDKAKQNPKGKKKK